VDYLKDKIGEKQKYSFATSKPELLLAKKGDDTWFTQKQMEQGLRSTWLAYRRKTFSSKSRRRMSK
jgi:dTDP-D-glucose 4,6-dehydratase